MKFSFSEMSSGGLILKKIQSYGNYIVLGVLVEVTVSAALSALLS